MCIKSPFTSFILMFLLLPIIRPSQSLVAQKGYIQTCWHYGRLLPQRWCEAGQGKLSTIAFQASVAEGEKCSSGKQKGKKKKKEKRKKREKLTGEDRFEEFYSEQFGERWIGLKQALLLPNRHAARMNSFLGLALEEATQILNASVPCNRFGGGTTGSSHYLPTLLVPIASGGNAEPAAAAAADAAPPSPSLQEPAQWEGGGAAAAAEAEQEEEEEEGSGGGGGGGGPFPPPRPLPAARASAGGGLMTHYCMDAASAVAAAVLGVRPGEAVLDLCAAPGGKTLALAEALLLEGDGGGRRGRLVANDRSSGRGFRLRATLAAYLPRGTLSPGGAVATTRHDATRWHLYESSAYDKILLDAPCSSERHVLCSNSKEHLAQWSPSRTKRLASQQKALLYSAAALLRPGGRLLYSTCALSELENEGAVGHCLRRQRRVSSSSSSSPGGGGGGGGGDGAGPLVALGPSDLPPELRAYMAQVLPGLERLKHGWLALPDRTGGWGPMYFALLEKKEEGGDKECGSGVSSASFYSADDNKEWQ